MTGAFEFLTGTLATVAAGILLVVLLLAFGLWLVVVRWAYRDSERGKQERERKERERR